MATNPQIPTLKTGNPLLDNPQMKLGIAAQMAANQPEPPNVMMPPAMTPQVPTITPSVVTGPKRGQEMLTNGQTIKPGTLLGDKIELTREAEKKPALESVYSGITGSKFGQAHPLVGKLLGGLAQIPASALDVAASLPFHGAIASLTPGTSLNHGLQIHGLENRIGQEEKNAETEAQTHNLDIQPELRMTQLDLNQQKQNLAEEKQNETAEHHQAQIAQQLRQHGYKTDETGAIVPLNYEEMSPQQQAVADLKGSQQELADARKAYVQAQKENLPMQMQMAQERIANAQRNTSVALGRLGLSEREFEFNQDKFYNPQPTGAERTRGDLAQSAINQVHAIREIVKTHPEIFGPAGGRAQRIQTWLGSQTPEAAQFNAARNYLAEHSAGVFGGRGKYIVEELQNITNPNSNPKALNAALDQAESTAQHFVDTGKIHGKPEENTPENSGNADYEYIPGKGLVKHANR